MVNKATQKFQRLAISLETGRQLFFVNIIWERPLMTSDFRVGRGVQNDPKIGRIMVERGR